MLEDAERLIAAWNERQAKRMPMLFSPTIGAAIAARFWFLWVRCPACRTTNAIDLRALDRHRDAPVTSLIPALSCRSCRPNAPFAEVVQLSRASIADEMREAHKAPSSSRVTLAAQGSGEEPFSHEKPKAAIVEAPARDALGYRPGLPWCGGPVARPDKTVAGNPYLVG